MSLRIDKSWVVVSSIEGEMGTRCVDVFRRTDGSFGFEEFRRDPEDQGRWTAVAHYAALSFSDSASALTEAKRTIAWLPAKVGER